MNCGFAVCATQSCSQSTPWLACVLRRCINRRWVSLRIGTAGSLAQCSITSDGGALRSR
jgi:hypothetical protein